ncbi:MAG: TM2 domain-containing protein [Bacteroidota bacterium]
MKDRLFVLLFASLAGGFGAHRFYLGDKKQARWFLIFCWTGIVYFVALADAIVLIWSREKFDARYNAGQTEARQYYAGTRLTATHTVNDYLPSRTAGSADGPAD